MNDNTVLLEASSLTNIMSEFNYNDDYFNNIPLCKKIKISNSLQNLEPYIENSTSKKIMKIINNMKRAGVTFCVNKSSYDIVNDAIANIGTDIEGERWEHFKKEYDLKIIDDMVVPELNMNEHTKSFISTCIMTQCIYITCKKSCIEHVKNIGYTMSIGIQFYGLGLLTRKRKKMFYEELNKIKETE